MRSVTDGDGKPQNTGTLGQRNAEKYFRQRQTEDYRGPSQPKLSPDTPGKIPALDDNMGSLTINTGHMTETKIRPAIQDAITAEQELFIRDENGKVPINSNTNLEDNLETSELELVIVLESKQTQ